MAQMSDSSHANSSHLCQPGMLDPAAAIALSFIANPSPFRLASRWTLNCYQHSIYLESERPCPYVTMGSEGAGKSPEQQTEELSSPRTVSTVFPMRLARTTMMLLEPKGGRQYKRKGETLPLVRPEDACKMHIVGVNSLCKLPNRFPPTRFDQDLVGWPSKCTELDVQHCPNLKTIGPDYPPTRRHLMNMRVVRLQDLPMLGTIENAVFKDCPTLEEVHLARLPELTSIKDQFCHSSEHIRNVSFNELPALETIGEYFLSSCHGLVQVEIASLPALRSIGKTCLNYCELLTKVCIRDLPALTTVGSYWIHNCEALVRVEFSGLPKLQEAGWNFLSHGQDVIKPNVLLESEVMVGEGCSPELVEQVEKGLKHRFSLKVKPGAGSHPPGSRETDYDIYE